MKNNFQKFLTSECPPRGNKGTFAKTWKYAACMLLAFILGIGQMWAADDVYYVMLYNNITDAGVLTSSSTLNYGIVKYSASTGKYASSTEITVEGMGTSKASKYNKGNISTFSTVGNWAAGSGTAYAAGGKFTALTIKLGTKTASSIKFIGYRNTSSTGEMTISETAKATAKKPSTYGDDCLLEWTGNFTGDVSVSVKDKKEHVGVFVITVPEAKCSVTYKAGEGTGDDVVDSDAKTVKAFADCSFTAPSGYEFKEWQDGSSNVVAAGTPVSASMTLTAIYRLIPTKYTITYDLDGAPGDEPTETDKAAGDAFNLAAAPSWAGHAFDGWLCNIDSEVKTAGSSYTMTAAPTTFTAQWHEVDCKIYSFTGGIGSAIKESSDKASVDADKLVLSGSAGVIKLVPAAGETFKAGDVITISGMVGNTAEAFGVKISASNAKGDDLGTASVAGTTIPLIASVALTGNADNLYISRKGGTTTTIYTCEVHRSCAEGIAAGLSYANATVNKLTTDAAFTNALTNANGLVIAGYTTSNAEVATVATNGQVTIVGVGTATITAKSAVQTKAGTLYAAGTASYTLTVATPATYAVTYAAGGGTGEMTDPSSPYVEDAEVTLLANAFTPPTGKEFDAWEVTKTASGNPVPVTDGKFTMPAEAVTVKATWKALTDKYTVIYKDGDTELDRETPSVGTKPAGIAEPEKALNTFAAWQKEGVDIALDDAFWATVAKDVTVTLTARWTALYAETADLATEAAGDKTAINTFFAGKNYASTIGSKGGYDTNASGYLGYKFKDNGDKIQFNLKKGKIAEIAFMYIETSFTISVDGAEVEVVANKSTSSTPLVKYVYANGADKFVELLNNSATDKTSVINKIVIRDPYVVTFDVNGGDAQIAPKDATPSVMLPNATKGTESFLGWYDGETKVGEAGDKYTPTANITLKAHWEAVSTDTRIKALTYTLGAAAPVDIYEADKNTFNIALPYAQAYDAITVAATPNHASASIKVGAELTVSSIPGTATFTIVAQSGAEENYTVNFTKAPKDGVCLIWGDVSADNTLTYNATKSKFYAESDVTLQNSDVKGKDGSAPSGKKFQKNGFLKIALNEGTFLEGDVVALNVTYGTANVMHVFKAQAATSTDVIGEAAGNTDAGLNKVAITEDAAILWLVRGGDYADWNPHVDYVAVYRPMNPVLKSITFDGTKIDVTSTTISKTLPNGADVTDVTPEIVWNGAGTAVVTTNDGNWAWGENTYVLTDKDGDATTYTITLTEAEHYVAQIGTTGYTSLTAAVDAARANDVIKLLDNVDLMATGLTIAKNMTLDLNGFNIKAGEQIDNDIVVPAGVKLTLVDNSTEKDGKIYTEQAYTGAVTGYGLVRVSGELLMLSGNIYAVIDSDPANLGQFAVALGAGGKATIEGGQIKAGWYAISNNGNNTGSTIIVSGGELISTADYAIYNPAKESTVTVSGGVVYGAAGAIAMNRGELTVTGGTITSKGQGSTGSWGDGTGGLGNAAIAANGRYESVSVEISGGTVIAEGDAIMITNGTVNPVEVAISGGQFSHVVPEEYCAKDFIPVTTPNDQDKYEVIAAGVIRAAAAQMAVHGNAYAVTLDNGIVVISSTSDGKFESSNQFDNSAADAAVALGADEGKYRYKGQHILLNFPKNVKEFTIYSYDNNTTDRKINKVTFGGDPSVDKLKNYDAVGTYTFTNNTTTKLRTMTATMGDDEIIPAGEYVYVGMSNAHTVFRILFTEAECTTPVINSTNAIRAKVGEEATVSVDATAIGASYTWYRCDNELGAKPQLIAGATKASYKFTKAAGNEYFKVVVGCNCSAETAEAIITAEEWYQVDRVNVTDSTEWSWAGVYDDAVAGPQINQAQKGLVLASYIDAPNFDKLEGNQEAYVYRKNDYPAYQGTSLKFTTEIPGMLIIDASYTNSGNKIAVNGHDLGELPKNHAADFKLAVPAGDVTITSTGMRIWAMKFDPDFSNYAVTNNHFNGYTRSVTEGRYGTICLPKDGVMTGAELYEVAYYDDTYEKIFLDEVLNGEMVAGRPYIFLTKEGVNQIAVYYTDEENATAGDYHGLFGSYERINLAANDHIYILKDNRYYFVDTDNVYCGANRAYFKMGVAGGISGSYVAPAPGRRRTSIGAGAPAVATGVEDVQGDNVQCTKVLINGELFIIRGEKMYDAKGQLVK